MELIIKEQLVELTEQELLETNGGLSTVGLLSTAPIASVVSSNINSFGPGKTPYRLDLGLD